MNVRSFLYPPLLTTIKHTHLSLFQSVTAKTPIAKIDVDAIEEDDDFEEFGSSTTWTTSATASSSSAEATKAAQWTSNWDDEDVGDEFTANLRAEVENAGDSK